MKRTIIEAIKQVMHAAQEPMSPAEVYNAILRDNLYSFNALDPQHVVRSQLRRYCAGIETGASRKTRHFELHTGGKYSLLERTPSTLATAKPKKGRSVAKRHGTKKRAEPEKNTIVLAIRRVMEAAGKPMTVQQIYNDIIVGSLYDFRASEPVHVVRSQIRRHCLGLDFPSASDVKHFELSGKDQYVLLDHPVRHRSELARIAVSPPQSLEGQTTSEVHPASAEGRDEVFISYSHRDKVWMQRLQVHLKPLVKRNGLTVWDDTQISPGSKWRDEIAAALRRARVAVLLVSADFLASDFITENELPPLLEAASSEGVIILPLIVSACRFHKTENLSQFQAVNPPGKPLNKMDRASREELLVKVADAVEAALYPA